LLFEERIPVAATFPEIERRTRIVCHFPLNRLPKPIKPNQLRVIHEFVYFLQRTPLTGFTMSALLENAWTGFWRPSLSTRFEKENVALILIDHTLEKDDPVLWVFLQEMKREIQRLYKRYAEQKEQDVWIVVHSIDRLV
jgi:hypothetical protein